MSIQKRDMISRRYVIKDKFPMENILKSLQQEINMNYYVLSEDEDSIFWTIKPEMLEGNFVEFLETQFKMYDEPTQGRIQDAILKIKEAQTGKKIIELAKKELFENFQMVDNILGYHRVLHADGFPDHTTVNYHLIAFFLDGKIIMEYYNNILHYFERNIRFQEQKYPVAACVKVMITS